VKFYASHPPLLQRIAALRKIKDEKKSANIENKDL
jgi:Zn-dependent protease with chaperone function